MATTGTKLPVTFADVFDSVGEIDPARIRLDPRPGTATEADHLRFHEADDRLYELVDGTLVEKPMGAKESGLTLTLGKYLELFLDENDLGVVLGESAGTQLLPGLVRVPDISYFSWDRLPERGVYPSEPILSTAPDLVIEILSPSNTRSEMSRKRKDYFFAGVRLVWEVDLRARSVTIYTAPDAFSTLTGDQTLEGGDVLPGFRLSLSALFKKVRLTEE